jgi:hypothetical protein
VSEFVITGAKVFDGERPLGEVNVHVTGEVINKHVAGHLSQTFHTLPKDNFAVALSTVARYTGPGWTCSPAQMPRSSIA